MVRFVVAVLTFVSAVIVAAQTAPESPPKGAAQFGTVVVATTGFKGEIYYLRRGTKHLPKFRKLKPKGAIYTPVLNVPTQSFQKGFPGLTNRLEWFGIDYRAHIWVRTPGNYRFSLLADDAADLYIDGHLVIDNDGQHPPESKDGSVDLTTGAHWIRVTYYQGPKYQVALVLKVAPPGHSTFEVFDTNDFTPPPSVTNW